MHSTLPAALVILASYVVALCPTFSSACDTSKYLTVNTTSGLVIGHIADIDSLCVVEYLGIPYAKPPIGKLRFAAPERFTSRVPYDAAKFGFDCPSSPRQKVDYPNMTSQAQQIIAYFTSSAGTEQSEDCLTLNVWSRAVPKSPKTGKPVLVFFYGGRFANGNTNTPFYNGKYFADAQDIIVVTVNYRTNIFGFPGTPSAPANLGLRDQRLAVEWVRDNIERFGGDPSKVTIAGQSAGGVAVDYWAYAYKDDPIVNGIIAASGNALSFPVNAPGVPEKNWDTVVSAVNCDKAEDVMACMRQVYWEDLKAAAAGITPTPSSSVLRAIPPFYPTPDNEIVFDNYTTITKAGRFAQVPILFGNTNNEDGYYRIPTYGNGGVVPTDEQVTRFLLESFTCPVSYQAQARRNNGIPAWAYRYMADWENTRLFPTSGAYHGVDMHMIFGASEDVTGIPPTMEQKELTKKMQTAWHTFSNDPQEGLSKLGWPKFDANEESLVILGVDTSARIEFVRPSVYDAACSAVTMGAMSSAT